MTTDARIDVLKEQLSDTKMHPLERAAIADDIERVSRIDDSTDETKELLKSMQIQGIRREIAAHARDAQHYKNCLVASQITEEENGTKVMPWEKGDKAIMEKIAQVQSQAQAQGDASSISVGNWSIKGPVTRLAIASAVILGFVWLMLNRQDQTLKNEMQKTIVPAVFQMIKDDLTKKVTKVEDTNKTEE